MGLMSGLMGSASEADLAGECGALLGVGEEMQYASAGTPSGKSAS